MDTHSTETEPGADWVDVAIAKAKRGTDRAHAACEQLKPYFESLGFDP